MKKKNERIIEIKSLVDLNFHYSLDIDSKDDISHCTCESICRCSTITNAHVKSVNISSILHEIKPAKYDDIFEYCLERILVALKLYRTDIWDISIRSGYYGEEIGSVVLDSELAKTCDSWITKLINLKNDDDRIRLVLEAEYGYVLDSLKKAKFRIETIKKSDIYFGQESYRKKVSLSEQEIYKDYEGICGIFEYDSRYRIIDGYHRCCSSTKDEIKILVC